MTTNHISKKMLLIGGIATLALVGVIFVFLMQQAPKADTIPLVNVAAASYCTTGEAATVCDPATGRFSGSARSNTVSTTITTGTTSSTPTPTPPPTGTFTISNVVITPKPNLPNQATATWTTSVSAQGFMVYSLSPDLSSSNRSSQTGPATSHNVTLAGLTTGSTYYYQIVMEIPGKISRLNGTFVAGSGTTSSTPTPTPTPTPTATPGATPTPAAGALSITQSSVTPSTTSAVVNWTTSTPTEGYVKYGETTSLGGISVHAPVNTTHSVNIQNLKSGTTYYYEINSEYLNKSVKKTGSFRTL